MKEFTFSFNVIEWLTANEEETADEIASISFKEELTDEQADRLEQSYASGNFQYLHEDRDIVDIYRDICDCIDQIADVEPGQEAELERIEYPEELVFRKEEK